MNKHRVKAANKFGNGQQHSKTLSSGKITFAQHVHHVDIDRPLVGKRLTGISGCRHIIRRAKLGENGNPFTLFFFAGNDPVPPGEMRIYRSLPLRRPGIGYLWTFRVTNARMNMLGPVDRQRYRFGLVLQKRFAHIAPVRYIEGEF